MKKSVLLIGVLAVASLSLAACDDDTQTSSSESSGSSTETSSSTTTSSTSTSSVSSGSSISSGSSVSSDSSSSSSSSSSSVEEDPMDTLTKALEKDYSNSTAVGEVSVTDGESSFVVYNYNGYNVVDDRITDDDTLLYYHDYEGESYLYFDDNYGNGAGWLNYGYMDSPLGLENTYWNYRTAIAAIDETDFTYSLGTYQLSDEATEEFAANVLGGYALTGELALNIEYCYIVLADEYISQIVGVIDDNSYVRVTLTDIGLTNPGFTNLPPEPTEDNIMTYEEYSGTTPLDKTVDSLSLSLKDGATTNLEIEDEVNLYLEINPYEAFDANSDVTALVSSDPSVIDVSYDYDDNEDDNKKVLKITALKEGQADVYVEVTNPDDTKVKSNTLHFTVAPLAGDTLVGEKVYDLSFVSVSGEDEDQTVTVTNAVQGKAVEARGTKLEIADPNYGDNKFDINKNILKMDPDGIPYGLESTLELDFRNQEVSGIAFDYGLIFESHENNVKHLSSVLIQVQEDDGSWSTDKDVTEQVKEDISGINLKHLQVQLTKPANKVRIVIDSNFSGAQISFGMQSLRAYADENCSSTVAPDVDLTDIVLNETYTVEEGKTVAVVPGLEPSGANNVTFTYEVEDTSIATVNTEGVLTGVAEGKTTLTVKATQRGKTLTKTAEIVVTPAYKVLESIECTNGEDGKVRYEIDEIGLDTKFELDIVINPEGAEDVELSYSSSNTAVCTVTDGVVTMYKTPGTSEVTITATQGEVSVSTSIIVEIYENLPEALPSEYIGTFVGNYEYGGDLELTVVDVNTITLKVNEDEYQATYAGATAKTEFEYVTEDGTSIILILGDTSDTINVRCADLDIYPTHPETLERLVNVESIEITNGEEVTVAPNTTLQINVTVNPTNATYANEITYETEDPAIATVDENGLVTGISAGQTTLTVTCDGKTDTILIKVEGQGVDISFLNGTWTNDNGDIITIEDGTLTIVDDSTNGMFYDCSYVFKKMENEQYVFEETTGYYFDLYLTLNDDGSIEIECPEFGSYWSNLVKEA